MNELASSICSLYEPDDAPVIAVSGGCILFYNSAALQMFPGIEEGKKASSVLPRAFLECNDVVFVSTSKVDEQSVSANGVWYNGMLLLRLHAAASCFSVSDAGEAFITKCRIELANMRLALDLLLKAENCDSTALSVMQHSYFKILNNCENLELASGIAKNSTVFKPVSIQIQDWTQRMVSSVNDAAEKMNISVSLVDSFDREAIIADPTLLEKMLLNLLSNCICRSVPGSTISLKLSRKGEQIRFILEDSGKGFTNDQLGCMFRRSCVDTSDSIGMSLYISWGIAELHGGTVTVSNRSRNGAKIEICFPLCADDYMRLRSNTESYSSSSSESLLVHTYLAAALPDSCFGKIIA